MKSNFPRDAEPVSITVLTRGLEKYVFLYRDDSVNAAYATLTLGKFASDPELSFTWSDAARVAKDIRARIVGA